MIVRKFIKRWRIQENQRRISAAYQKEKKGD
jgi:hypothetical protein